MHVPTSVVPLAVTILLHLPLDLHALLSPQMLMTQKQQQGGGKGGKGGDKYSRMESAIEEDNEQFIRGQQQRQEVCACMWN